MHSKDLKNILITIAIKELLANNWNKIDIKFLKIITSFISCLISNFYLKNLRYH